MFYSPRFLWSSLPNAPLDPIRGFLPTAGMVLAEREPRGQVRLDSGLRPGEPVAVEYDPMLAKVIAYPEDRPTAL